MRPMAAASRSTRAALLTYDTCGASIGGRHARRRMPRTIAAKTEMLQLRLMEKKRELVRQEDVDALIDQIAGVTLTALSSLPARCAPRGDLAIRRSIERVVFEVRREIAEACSKRADETGEPPLDEQ